MPAPRKMTPRDKAIAAEVVRQLRQGKPPSLPEDRVPLTIANVKAMPRAEIIERMEEIDAWIANDYQVPEAEESDAEWDS